MLCLETGKLTFSKNFYHLLGLSPEISITALSDIAIYLHPGDQDKLLHTEKAMHDEHYIPEYEYRVTKGERVVKLIKQSGEEYEDEKGRKCLKGYIQEVTGYTSEHNSDNFMYLRKLKDKLSFTELLSDTSIDQTLVLDTQFAIVSWNKQSEHITGIAKQDILGRNIFDVFPKIRTCPAVVRAMKHAMNGYNAFVPEEKGRYEPGHYENHFIPLKDDEENVIGVLNIKHDVAHRIKSENELKALNKTLARKNKELKAHNAELHSFSHVTSHDLKEPLRKIYTFIELFLAKENHSFSETGKMYFKRIQASVRRMGLLTDDILAFCELETERNKLADVDLNNILVFAMHNLRELTHAKSPVIEADNLPVYTGYRPLLTQLFQSLMSNAIKFQHHGIPPHIKISAAYVSGNDINHIDAVAGAEYLKLSFSDNGIGFEKIYTDRIFEMFMRLNSADDYAGSGIGLALCKKITELHHGFMVAESELNKGSTFHCYLQTNLK